MYILTLHAYVQCPNINYPALLVVFVYYSAPNTEAEYCDKHVCPRAYLRNYT